MPDIIQLLADNVANQIAAGEVVQRPASVVKELLENSVDAGAKLIQLVVKESGKTLIQVSDDGCGMSETDARMAFERHATSKIRKAEDIFSIITKGFRGEALASIAAVAQVEIKTRRPEDELGTQLKIAASRVEKQEFCNCPVGTQFEVRHLFYNIPARRNFLKSDAVELRHIIDEFERVALAHPECEFHFEHNQSEIFRLPASGLRQRIVGIFGKRYREKLVPVNEDTELVRLQGFVGKPEFAKKTRGEQFSFVNHRFIRNAYLHKAVQKGFEELLPEGYHPSYFLFLEIDPARIDVNIHPTKTEVKFEDDRAVFTIIRTAIKHALGQYNISPSLDFEHDAKFAPPPSNGPVPPPGITVNPYFNPFEEEARKKAGGPPPRPVSRDSQNWEALLSQVPEMGGNRQIQADLDASEDQKSPDTKRKFVQIARKYLLAPHGDGLLLLHQNRAHQRILYEKILRSMSNRNIPSQQLLFPQSLHFKASDWALLQEMLPRLREMGFDLEPGGEGELLVQALPLYLDNPPLQKLFEELLEGEKDHQDYQANEAQEKMARVMAKVAALRSGTVLEPEAMQSLMDELFACETPYFSPEGKATLVQLKAQDIDAYFS